MKKYEPKDIRNIVLVGQRGVGKTSLGEAHLSSVESQHPPGVGG
jgi:GTPase SAR1 family protein